MSAIARLSTLDATAREDILRGAKAADAARARWNKALGAAMVLWGPTLFFAGTIVDALTARGVPRSVAGLSFFVLGVVFFLGLIVVLRRVGGSDVYKREVVQRVVAALGGGLRYRPQGTLTREQLNALELFPRSAGRRAVDAEDEISGEILGITFSFQEVNASGVFRHRDAVERRDKDDFVGTMLRLEFNKHFTGHTVVIPADEAAGFAPGDEARNGKPLVRLENPDFERAFSTYSSNDQQARYLLTPKFMELVLATRDIIGVGDDLRLCFVGNSLFLASSTRINRFEDDAKRTDPQRVADQLATVVRLVQQIIDSLELDVRIWTRE